MLTPCLFRDQSPSRSRKNGLWPQVLWPFWHSQNGEIHQGFLLQNTHNQNRWHHDYLQIILLFSVSVPLKSCLVQSACCGDTDSEQGGVAPSISGQEHPVFHTTILRVFQTVPDWSVKCYHQNKQQTHTVSMYSRLSSTLSFLHYVALEFYDVLCIQSQPPKKYTDKDINEWKTMPKCCASKSGHATLVLS